MAHNRRAKFENLKIELGWPYTFFLQILFINGILKEHSTEGPALTLHTTMHILQALVQMDGLEISYARLMRKCPVVQLSVQV